MEGEVEDGFTDTLTLAQHGFTIPGGGEHAQIRSSPGSTYYTRTGATFPSRRQTVISQCDCGELLACHTRHFAAHCTHCNVLEHNITDLL